MYNQKIWAAFRPYTLDLPKVKSLGKFKHSKDADAGKAM